MTSTLASVYHLLPEYLIGNCIRPLNQLRDKYPDEYARHVQKYAGRESLLGQRIPVLDCLWNDVIHLSPIDPRIVLTELRRIHPSLELKRTRYLKIPARHLDVLNAVWMTRGTDSSEGSFYSSGTEFVRFGSSHYEELTRLPEKTIAYWKRAHSKNQALLWFNHVPHVFLKGDLSLDLGEICRLE